MPSKHALFRISVLFGLGMAIAGCGPRPALAQGTVIVPISNAKTTCIDAVNKTVDLWLLSARIPKKQTWLTDVKGVGVRVDVQISGNGQKVSFPAAKSIDTSDLNGKIVRASLSLHILADQDLWDPTNKAAPIQTNNIDTPVTFVRRQGSSDTVKVFQTLLSFTNTVGATLPPNPYVKGVEMAGQLANSLQTVFQPDPNAIVDPDFALSFGVGRSDTGCRPTEIQEGVAAQIADSDLGDESAGIVRTANLANYCFYKLGGDNAPDPDIGFSHRTAATCPTVVPADVKTLNNPQFIWYAYGNCKPDKTCGQPAVAAGDVVRQVAQLANASAEINTALAQRIGQNTSNALAATAARPAAAPQRAVASGRSALRSVEMCKKVGIPAERCLSKAL